MQTFILLTRLVREEVHPTFNLQTREKAVVAKIKEFLPDVAWISNYAIMGPWDYLDVFEAKDTETAAKVSMLVRHYGGAHTEVWPATPWKDFELSISHVAQVIGKPEEART